MVPFDPIATRRTLNGLLNKRNAALAQIKADEKASENANKLVEDVLEAQKYLQEIAQTIQQQAHKQMAKVVSRCLSAVFKQPYELKIEFECKRGKTEAEFVYLRAGRRVRPKLASGGVRHVAALALRLGELVMQMPSPRKFLCLDEPFKGLSGHNLKKMATLIETLSQELDVQFLICTHDEALEIGKVIRL